MGSITSQAKAKATTKARKSWKQVNSKRHARDFTEGDEEVELEDALLPAATPAPETIAKRCSGLDHSCELTADVLFE